MKSLVTLIISHARFVRESTRSNKKAIHYCANTYTEGKRTSNGTKLPCEIVYMDEVFRDHEERDGNYFQLLKLRMEDVPDLEMYLRITTNFTSPGAQNPLGIRRCFDVDIREI